MLETLHHHYYHYHYHYNRELWTVRRSAWSLTLKVKSFHLFLGRPMFLFPFILYFSACFDILSVAILSTCCSHSRWYCFISKTMFCIPSFSLKNRFLSMSNLVIHNKCIKNSICAASSLSSSLFFSTQTSLPNFKAALAVILWILNFVSLVISFPKYLRIM